MMATRWHRRCAWLLAIVLLIVGCTSMEEPSTSTVRVLETLTAELAADGTAERARMLTRTEDPDEPSGYTEEDRSIEVDELPIVVRVAAELDGEAIEIDDLRGRSGEIVVRLQVRNTSSDRRQITYGTVDGEVTDTVAVALPLFTEVTFDAGPGWQQLETDAGVVSAGLDGGSEVRWQTALFEPFGAIAAAFELRGELEDGTVPRLLVESYPITVDSSPLLASSDRLLTERATLDALAAVVASGLQDAVAGAAAGTDQLATGLNELGTEVGAALADLQDLDPGMLADDALAALAGQLDPQLVLDELIGELPGPDALAAELDGEALLREAGFDALIEELLASAIPDPDDLADLVFDEELLAGALDDALAAARADLEDSITLDALLQELDLAAVLADLDLEDRIADALAAVDLAAALEELLVDADPAELLADVDLEPLLADLIADTVEGLTVADLVTELLDEVADRPLGEVIGEVELGPLVALLLGTDDLELELAALLAPVLDTLEIDLPTVPVGALADIVTKLGRAVVVIDGFVDKLETLEAGLGQDVPVPVPVPSDPPELLPEAAVLSDALATRLRDTAGAIGEGDLFGPVMDELEAAGARVSAVTNALDAAEAALDPEQAPVLAPVRDAVADLDAALVEATDRGAAAAATGRDQADRLTGILIGTSDRLGGVAELLAQAGAPLPDRPDAVPDIPPDLASRLAEVRADLVRLREGLTGIVDTLESLIAAVDGDELDLGAALQAALDDATVDLVPLVAALEDRVADRLDAVRLADLPLEELFAALDLELELAPLLADLLADLDLPDLAALLDGLDLDLTQLIAALDLDLDAALAEAIADLPDLDDLLADIDPADLLDALELDPADLLPDLDPTELFDELDVAALLGEALDDLPAPDIDDLLDELDLDLGALLEAAGLDPAALLDDIDPPDAETLLQTLDIDPDELAAGLGLDTLADLDEVAEGLADAVAGLARGASALTDGLETIADQGLAELVAQLDEDNREAQRDLALLRALDVRAGEAGTAPTPPGVAASVRYRLATRPAEPLTAQAVALTLLLAAGGAAEALRRRWTPT